MDGNSERDIGILRENLRNRKKEICKERHRQERKKRQKEIQRQ